MLTERYGVSNNKGEFLKAYGDKDWHKTPNEECDFGLIQSALLTSLKNPGTSVKLFYLMPEAVVKNPDIEELIQGSVDYVLYTSYSLFPTEDHKLIKDWLKENFVPLLE